MLRKWTVYYNVSYFHFIVLDFMLPVEDGLSICRRLRQSNIDTPIIMLTARVAIQTVLPVLKLVQMTTCQNHLTQMSF